MTRWEYKVYTAEALTELIARESGLIDTDKLARELDELGREGWELVTGFDSHTVSKGTRAAILVFKRPAS